MQHHQCGPFFYLTRELRIARANASVTVLNEFISALQEVSQNPSLFNNHKAFQKSIKSGPRTAFEGNLRVTWLLYLRCDKPYGASPFLLYNPIMWKCVISQSLLGFSAPVNTIKMFSQETGLCIRVIESHKSPCNIPVSVNWSKWFVIGVFMAQASAAKSAGAD